MAGQLNSFVHKFYSLWNTGNDACLNLECHAGKAQIHLQLNLQLQPQPQHQPRHHPPPPPQQPRRHLGPSQLRRRARRELARATAAEAANPAAENADDDAAPAPLAEQAQPPPNNGPQHAAAVQAGHLPAEQAQFPLQPPQVCDSVCPDPQHAAAVQAGHLPAEQAHLPPQPPQVCDSVCPDYETLPAVQVGPHHLPLHQDCPLAPQQDRRLTLKISARHALGRRYGLRRALLQQRHLQAHEVEEEPHHRQEEPLHQRHSLAHQVSQPAPHHRHNEDQQIQTIESDEDEPQAPQAWRSPHHLWFRPHTQQDHMKIETLHSSDPDLLEWMKARVEYLPVPCPLGELEFYAYNDRREHQEKFKTFSKFQAISKQQFQMKYLNMKERNEPFDL